MTLLRKFYILALPLCIMLAVSGCGSANSAAPASEAASTPNPSSASDSISTEAASTQASGDEEASDSPSSEANVPSSSVETLKAEADGITMHYLRFGNGDKTMVVLPGVSAFHVTDSGEAVAAGFADFAEDFTVYLFDVKEDVPEGYTLQQMAEDTKTIMLSLGLQDICLYGVSMGGMMSVYIAGKYPELIERLVLASTTCTSSDIQQNVLEAWASLAESGDRSGLAESVAKTIYSENTIAAYGDVLTAGYDTLTDEAMTRFSRCVSSMFSFDFSEEAAAIKCPVLVLGSKGDAVLTPDAPYYLAAQTNGTLYLYGEEYGHAVYDEAPDFKERVLTSMYP